MKPVKQVGTHMLSRAALAYIASALSICTAAASPPIGRLSMQVGASKIASQELQIVNLAQIPNDSKRQFAVILKNESSNPMDLSLFPFGEMLAATWSVVGMPYKMPRNFARLMPASTREVLVELDPARNVNDSLHSILIRSKDGRTWRIVLNYILRGPRIVVGTAGANFDSGRGEAWSDYYRVCTGPAPYGYTLDRSRTTFTLSQAITDSRGIRNCKNGARLDASNPWTQCRTLQLDDENVCFDARVQGHKGGCFLGMCNEDTVPVWERATATWTLKEVEPTIVLAADAPRGTTAGKKKK